MRSTEDDYNKPPVSSRLGMPQHFKWLLGIVKVILVLNLFDMIFTLLWIYAGLARESNPLLADLIDKYPILFATVKLTLVSLGSILLWRYRFRPLAIISIFLAFIVYYYLFLYQISFLGRLIHIFFES